MRVARVLVTGGSGFIGGALARRLRHDRVHEVLTPPRSDLDLLRPDARAFLDNLGRADVVVHCAASRGRADPDPGRLRTELAINVAAAALLYEWARVGGARAIVHVSTLSVVRPDPDPARLLEDDGPRVEPPAHPYALTKRWAEELVATLRPSFEAAAIVRPGMAYGREMSPGSGMGRLLDAVRSGRPYELAGATGHRYAPVHVDDVVDVLVQLAGAPRNVTVTVGGPTPLFEREIVTDLAGLLGREVAFVERPSERPMSNAPSTANADALFPGRVRTPWLEGAARSFAV